MKIFLNVEVRRLFITAAAVLLAALLAGQALVGLAAADYRTALIAHDAALAGALLDQGLDPAAAAAVFTAPKTEAQRVSGAQALARAGVTGALDYEFLPEAASFLRRYSAAALGAALVFSALLLGGLYGHELRRDRRIVQASRDIQQFLQAGDQGARLALHDAAEGSQAQFFSAVNGMAASLTAHLQKEQHDREFLKETISDISHQLKTPLSALRMYIEIIRDENAASPVIDSFTQKSQRELGRMEALIQNLLKLARLDAGTILLEKRRLPLNEFLANTLERFAVRAEVEGKELHLVCPGGLALDGDEQWLAEAAGNLIKNALDHTPAGGIIQVLCEETPLVVSIAVKDNGAGIHPDDLPYIFKRFYRSRFSQDHQGVGIGLTLARSIVEKHGGSMTVESEPGQGAAFQMIFPKLTNL